MLGRGGLECSIRDEELNTPGSTDAYIDQAVMLVWTRKRDACGIRDLRIDHLDILVRMEMPLLERQTLASAATSGPFHHQLVHVLMDQQGSIITFRRVNSDARGVRRRTHGLTRR